MSKIYIVKHGKYHKIGKSNNPEKRACEFANVIMPHPFEVVYMLDVQNASISEKMLHNYFSKKRRAGEWFRLSSIDILLIKLNADHIRQLSDYANHIHWGKKIPDHKIDMLFFVKRIAFKIDGFITAPYWRWRVKKDMRNNG